MKGITFLTCEMIRSIIKYFCSNSDGRLLSPTSYTHSNKYSSNSLTPESKIARIAMTKNHLFGNFSGRTTLGGVER